MKLKRDILGLAITYGLLIESDVSMLAQVGCVTEFIMSDKKAK